MRTKDEYIEAQNHKFCIHQIQYEDPCNDDDDWCVGCKWKRNQECTTSRRLTTCPRAKHNIHCFSSSVAILHIIGHSEGNRPFYLPKYLLGCFIRTFSTRFIVNQMQNFYGIWRLHIFVNVCKTWQNFPVFLFRENWKYEENKLS